MDQFYPYELNIILILSGTILIIIFKNYFSSDPLDLWSPLTIIGLIYLYYVIAGPAISIINEDTFYRLIDHRDYFIHAWKLSILSYISVLIGFNLKFKVNTNKILKIHEAKGLEKIFGLRLFYLGVVFLIVITGFTGFTGQLTFWGGGGAAKTGYQGTFTNYLYHSINFFIPASAFLLVAVFKKKIKLIYFLLVVFVAIAVYTSEAFRWRHVLLILTLVITFFTYKKIKPKLIWLVAIGLATIMFMGIIGSTRQYGRGLNLNKIEGKQNEEVFMEGFSEATVFMTTGLMVEMVPSVFGYIYFDPIIQSIVMPIPRKWWPSKPSGDYIAIMESLYGEGGIGKGVAVLNVGEYYLAFGWAGAAIGSFFIGFFYKRLWLWFKANRTDPFVIVTYATAVSFLYVIISRGYLPQVFYLFFFTVYPAYYVYRIHLKENKRAFRNEMFKKRYEGSKAKNIIVEAMEEGSKE